MANVIRWEPFRRVDNFPTLGLESFAPSFDVKATKHALVIQADVPGMTARDVAISAEGNRLTLSGERKSEQARSNENYYVLERAYGCFHRTFTLPEPVEVDKVQVELNDGVLTLTVPQHH
jgi:HSP20 family protein